MFNLLGWLVLCATMFYISMVLIFTKPKVKRDPEEDYIKGEHWPSAPKRIYSEPLQKPKPYFDRDPLTGSKMPTDESWRQGRLCILKKPCVEDDVKHILNKYEKTLEKTTMNDKPPCEDDGEASLNMYLTTHHLKRVADGYILEGDITHDIGPETLIAMRNLILHGTPMIWTVSVE